MSLLGKDSITITDITDVNPIRLDLTSSQPIYQTKRINGNYEPDYENNSLIITPFLYFGVEEVNREKYKDKISFYLNGHIVENTENIYIQDTKLYIKQNLIENTKIEAVITDITDDRTKVTYETISESLSFYLLSYDSSGYTAFIDSSDGRYDFSSTNSNQITLRAHLYLGTTELNTVSYEWKRSSGLEMTNNKGKSLDITRGDIHSHENFICEMTYEGVTFTATCAIDDRTDLYTSTIISDTSLVMTPSFKTANFTCKIFKNQGEVTGGTIEYSWIYYENGSTDGKAIGGNTKDITITLGDENMPKDSFTLYCTATIDRKFITVAYLPVSYSVSYTPILTPKTIFIPANSDGSYKGEGNTIETTLTFFLQGDNGDPINAELSNFSINGVNYTTTKIDNKYLISFSLAVNDFNSLETSSMFELSYKYKEKDFNEEFYIVKNVQGLAGENGASYSLILSNDYHRFSGKEIYAIEGQTISTIVSFYKGDEIVKIENIKIGSKVLTTTPQEIDTGGLTAKITNTASDTKEIIFTTLKNKLSVGGVIEIQALVKINEQEHIFVTMFTYDINYEGNSYFLSFTNGTSIIYLPSKDSFSPKKLAFYAYYRRNGSGENLVYHEGKVFYSEDNSSKKTFLSPKDGAAYYEYQIKQNLQNNVTFYLYTSQANNTNPEEIYLMDRETIPIITSLEGAEIGGENLIRFSGTLEQLSDRWSYEYGANEEIAIRKDNEVNSAIFNFNKGACSITSPLFFIGEEIKDKYLCFSFYFKDNNGIVNERINGNNIYFSLLSYNSSGGLLEEKIFSIFDIKIDEDKTIEQGKWIRLYEIFKIGASTASYFKIRIGGIINSTNTSKTYKFEIKKPKLELGNTPTAWSKANNDILFEGLNVDFSNLNGSSIVDILNKQIENIKANSNSIANGNISITTKDGNKIFDNLNSFYDYLNNSINEVKNSQVNKYNLIDSQLNSLSGDLSDGIGKLNEIRNAIKLGYDDKNKFEPYMLFVIESSEKKSSMKLTTNRLSFILNDNELAYFGANSLTIERARVREGFYLGSGNNGYLAVRTTAQGCAFTWESTFTE